VIGDQPLCHFGSCRYVASARRPEAKIGEGGYRCVDDPFPGLLSLLSAHHGPQSSCSTDKSIDEVPRSEPHIAASDQISTAVEHEIVI
jgi:hypothetical protein